MGDSTEDDDEIDTCSCDDDGRDDIKYILGSKSSHRLSIYFLLLYAIALSCNFGLLIYSIFLRKYFFLHLILC